jgi:predicted NUDIX family phosphoesterase
MVLVFEENLLYGFSGLLGGDYPNSIELGGISYTQSDLLWLKECIKQSYFMPRGLVEDDPKYKQIIPYIIITCKEFYLTYQRIGSESRLYNNISIGIGGHINYEDYYVPSTSYKNMDKLQIINNCAKREFSEELDLSNSVSDFLHRKTFSLNNPVAVLYKSNGENNVNRVHFGVVYKIPVTEEESVLIKLKSEGKNLDWMTSDELLLLGDRLEDWSRLIICEKC